MSREAVAAGNDKTKDYSLLDHVTYVLIPVQSEALGT